MSSLPDHLYLDLSTINNDNTGSKIKQKLEFTELRNNPFLENPENYFLGIARFEVDTAGFSLPVFQPILLLDGSNTDLNKTIYTITMGNNITGKLSNSVAVNVMWRPEDQTATLPNNKRTLDASGNIIPNSPYTTQDFSTGYYNTYSTKWWINCINVALIECWTTLTGLSSSSAPFLTIDSITNLVTLLTPSTLQGHTSINFASLTSNSSGFYQVPYGTITYPPFLNDEINYAMFFNEPLFNLLSSLNSVYYGVSSSYTLVPEIFDSQTLALYRSRPYLFNYYVQPINYNGLNNNTTIVDSSGNTILFTTSESEYSPVPMWNPVSQIIFTSNLLPIAVSLTNVPVVYNSNFFDLNYVGNGNNSNVSSMLTDIEVALTTGTEYKPSVLYIPKNEYRLVDLLGANPINQASFSISWKTKYGNVIPFKLGSQCGANIKLLFRRKRFNLNNLPPFDSN